MVFKEVLTVTHCTHWTLARSLAPLPPSLVKPSTRYTFQAGDFITARTLLNHVRLRRRQRRESPIEKGGSWFFARELRSRRRRREVSRRCAHAVVRTAIISLSLSVCLSVCLLQSAPDPLCSPNHRHRHRHPLLFSLLLSSPLFCSLHPYVSGTGHNGLRDGPVGRRRHRPRPEDGG